ncbi:MAG: hypothetical protein JWO85_3184 [Candidatus Eremiobacteraeota bacterium]|nr:hypothetical protein [Candidatus Eremiobacteraeota bacterium]
MLTARPVLETARLTVRLADADDAVAASVNLSNVVRGIFQACHRGYSVDAVSPHPIEVRPA